MVRKLSRDRTVLDRLAVLGVLAKDVNGGLVQVERVGREARQFFDSKARAHGDGIQGRAVHAGELPKRRRAALRG